MQVVQQGHDFHRPLAVVPVPPSAPAAGADFNSRPKDASFDGTQLLCSTVFVRNLSYSSGCRVWQPCMSADICKKVCWKTSEFVLERNSYLSERGIVLLLFVIALVFFVRGREEERSNTGERLDWGRDYWEICCF